MDYLYKIYKENADPRVSEWPLVQSPWPMLILTASYLYIVWQGPKWMAHRKPFDLKPLLIVYNLSLVALSVYMFWELFASSVLNPNFSLTCEPVDYSTTPAATRLANVIWWYYFSKIVEFMDTFRYWPKMTSYMRHYCMSCDRVLTNGIVGFLTEFFFILRKKNNQITFLHIYHHSTMVLLWYIGAKYLAGGESYFSAMINSFIHILMYMYYGLSACGPAFQKYLWWKKYMTSLQLLQFGVVVMHTAVAIHTGCDFPIGWQIFLILYLTSHIVLFTNFFCKTFVQKDRQKKAAKQPSEFKPKERSYSKLDAKNGYHGYVPYDLLYDERKVKKTN